MIRIAPTVEARPAECPRCGGAVPAESFVISGMRNLADGHCRGCGRRWLVDLPAGHGLYYPMTLDPATGEVFGGARAAWFADWLARSYAERMDEPVPWSVEKLRPVRRALVLNCLDTLYGHSLLKLLNVQFDLDHRQEFDSVVIVPRFLRFLVPDGYAEVWTVDRPLRQGTQWNDWLARAFAAEIARFDECFLSEALSHPHPDHVDIERFTRVAPFPWDQWIERSGRPTVTFICREDRVWAYPWSARAGAVSRRIAPTRPGLDVAIQSRRIAAWAAAIRRAAPKADVAVAGLGRSGRLPGWITDLRVERVDEPTERTWLARYAASHVVVGVHGSNILLPSSLAGALIDLMPQDRWGNYLQDVLVRPTDSREALFLCRALPAQTRPAELAAVTLSLITDYESMVRTYSRHYTDHGLSLLELSSDRAVGP